MKTSSTSNPIKTPAETLSTDNLEQQIRLRAYELYEGRGKVDGTDLDDWLQAEAELTKKKTRTAVA